MDNTANFANAGSSQLTTIEMELLAVLKDQPDLRNIINDLLEAPE